MKKSDALKHGQETSLVAQWLRLRASNAVGELRSYLLMQPRNK